MDEYIGVTTTAATAMTIMTTKSGMEHLFEGKIELNVNDELTLPSYDL